MCILAFDLRQYIQSKFSGKSDRETRERTNIPHVGRSRQILSKKYQTIFLVSEIWTYLFTYFIKGGLISENISLWLHLQKTVPNHNSEHVFFRWIVLRIVTWHIFLEMKKLSEIKPSLLFVSGYDLSVLFLLALKL